MATRVDQYFNLGTNYRGRILVEDTPVQSSNYSAVRFRVFVRKDSGTGFWNSNGGTRSWSVTGVSGHADQSGSSSYDYRTTSGVPVGGEVQLADFTHNITHSTAGTYSDAFTVNISHADNPPGSGSVGPTVSLTDFPEPAAGSLSSTNVTFESATINAAVSTHGNGSSTTLTFYYRKGASGGYTNLGSGTSKTITGLESSTLYQWYVTAVNNTGNSSTSAVQSFTTAVSQSNFIGILTAL